MLTYKRQERVAEMDDSPAQRGWREVQTVAEKKEASSPARERKGGVDKAPFLPSPHQDSVRAVFLEVAEPAEEMRRRRPNLESRREIDDVSSVPWSQDVRRLRDAGCSGYKIDYVWWWTPRVRGRMREFTSKPARLPR